MRAVATKNNHGQLLGRKGLETRSRLMSAAIDLLKSGSPVELSAVSIAKKAGASSSTFYLYFRDVRGILLALTEQAETDMNSVHSILDEPWKPDVLDITHAQRVIEAYVSVFERHREILRYRNLEADRGDTVFANIRLRTSVRIVNRFAAHIFSAYGGGPETWRSAYADASVLVAAMERLATADLMSVERGVGRVAMWDAMTRVLAQSLGASRAVPI